MEIDLIHLVSFVVIVIVAVNFTIYRSVQMLRDPGRILKPVAKIDNAVFRREAQKMEQWGQALGFRHEQNFLFCGVIGGAPICCASWISDKARTRALVYVAGNKVSRDFVTKYSDVLGLTTASTKDAFTLPNLPTAYMQAFTRCDIATQYKRHLAGRQRLQQKLGVAPVPPNRDVLAELKGALEKQAGYITSLPLWYARGVFWYFVQRPLKVNKPVVVVVED